MPRQPAVLTAATVHAMASKSRLALARAGQAAISYRQTDNGAWRGSGKDTISFARGNWNDVISQAFPGSEGQRPQTQVAIDRIVDGQFYLHTNGPHGRVRWYRDTNPSNHPRVNIPDPRTLFGLLDPSARFKVIGHEVIGGLRLTELRATKAPRLRALGWLPGVASAGIDPKLSATVRHDIQVAAVSVIFSGFDSQPVITAPKNAIPQYSRS